MSADSSSSSSSSSNSNSNADVNVGIRIVICQANGGQLTVDTKKHPTSGVEAACKAGIDKRPPIVKVPKKKLRAKRNRTVQLRLSCPAHEQYGCRGVPKLRTAKAVPNRLLSATTASRMVIGQKKFTIQGGRTKAVKVRLTNRSYSLLQRAKKLRIWVKINAQDKAGNTHTAARAITLLPPRRQPSTGETPAE